jgi:hypothetical protein
MSMRRFRPGAVTRRTIYDGPYFSMVVESVISSIISVIFASSIGAFSRSIL